MRERWGSLSGPATGSIDRAALGPVDEATRVVEHFERRNSALNQGVVASSGLGTMVVEVLGERPDPRQPGQRAAVYLKAAEQIAERIKDIPGKVITVDFVVSNEVAARKESKNDRVHAVITYQCNKPGVGVTSEQRTAAQAMTQNDIDAEVTTRTKPAAARRGVLSRNGLLFTIDRQVLFVDGSDPETLQRNNLRYSINRTDLVFEPRARHFDLKKCTHAIGQDYHMTAYHPTQEVVDAYVFKLKAGVKESDIRALRRPLGPFDGVSSEIDAISQKSLLDNEPAARGVKLPDGSTVRIVHFRPKKSVGTDDVLAVFTNRLAEVADECDIKEVLGFDFGRPWGRFDKESDDAYMYFSPWTFMRTIDGPNAAPTSPADDFEPQLTAAEYRSLISEHERHGCFDGVVHYPSGYGSALIEDFAPSIDRLGATFTIDEQHLRFLKRIYAWYLRQRELGREPEILSTSFALDEGEFSTPQDKQYRRRLRIFFRDRNAPKVSSWDEVVPADQQPILSLNERASAEIVAQTARGQYGYDAGDEKVFMLHYWGPPPENTNPNVAESSVAQLRNHWNMVNVTPGYKPVEYVPMRYAWEHQETHVGANFTDAILVRAQVAHDE